MGRVIAMAYYEMPAAAEELPVAGMPAAAEELPVAGMAAQADFDT